MPTTRPMRSWVLCILALLTVPAAAGITLGDDKTGATGKQVFDTKCLKCHKQSKFKELHYALSEWEQIVTRMELNTCVLSDAERSAVCDYLAKEFGL